MSRVGGEAFGWGTDRARRASEAAWRMGLLISVKKDGGNGHVLKSAPGNQGELVLAADVPLVPDQPVQAE